MEQINELLMRSKEYLSDARLMAEKSRKAFRSIRTSTNNTRSQVLIDLANQLEQSSTQKDIIKANQLDLDSARINKLSPALYDRLKLDKKRIQDIGISLLEIAAMPDPTGEIVSGKTLASGVRMIKKRVPLGVVFTIYESRPNVTIDIGALCIKSGNAAILRGGKEAAHTNSIFYELFMNALLKNNLPRESLQLITQSDRAYMLACLQLDDLIDIVVPRGGEALIRFTAQNSRIPIVKHDKGVCNLYVDKDANLEKAIAIAINAKLQRPGVCNSIENLLINKEFPQIRQFLMALNNAGAKLLGSTKLNKEYDFIQSLEDDKLNEIYHTEFLDERLSVVIVDDMNAALDFIDTYGSGHSETIITENLGQANEFSSLVDTAAVCINCSSRFHDGGQMGMGAEVGISTGRLHVRGPMGVNDLTTTTYILSGNGQVRS